MPPDETRGEREEQSIAIFLHSAAAAASMEERKLTMERSAEQEEVPVQAAYPVHFPREETNTVQKIGRKAYWDVFGLFIYLLTIFPCSFLFSDGVFFPFLTFSVCFSYI